LKKEAVIFIGSNKLQIPDAIHRRRRGSSG